MDARRVRMLVGSAMYAGLLGSIWVGSAAAADCNLSAPAAVNVGTQLTITGTGFPPSASVDIELTVEGGASDAFPTQTNAAGELQINLTPEAAEVGVTTISASAGSDCSAEVVVTIVGAGETLPPTTAPGGGAAGASSEAVAPRTDAGVELAGGLATPNRGAWLTAFLVFGIGLAGLFVTRPSRGDRLRR